MRLENPLKKVGLRSKRKIGKEKRSSHEDFGAYWLHTFWKQGFAGQLLKHRLWPLSDSDFQGSSPSPSHLWGPEFFLLNWPNWRTEHQVPSNCILWTEWYNYQVHTQPAVSHPVTKSSMYRSLPKCHAPSFEVSLYLLSNKERGSVKWGPRTWTQACVYIQGLRC